MYRYYVPLLCNIIMYRYYVLLLCTVIMYRYYVPLLCNISIHIQSPLGLLKKNHTSTWNLLVVKLYS